MKHSIEEADLHHGTSLHLKSEIQVARWSFRLRLSDQQIGIDEDQTQGILLSSQNPYNRSVHITVQLAEESVSPDSTYNL
jgi:hypothetical protein